MDFKLREGVSLSLSFSLVLANHPLIRIMNQSDGRGRDIPSRRRMHRDARGRAASRANRSIPLPKNTYIICAISIYPFHLSVVGAPRRNGSCRGIVIIGFDPMNPTRPTRRTKCRRRFMNWRYRTLFRLTYIFRIFFVNTYTNST